VNFESAGIVVPTLGTRNQFLAKALHSVREAGPSFIVIVTPDPSLIWKAIDKSLFDLVVTDPQVGLAGAINTGVAHLPSSISCFNWLGDDDLLAPGSLFKTLRLLEQQPKVCAVFGKCSYIDENENVLWLNRSGAFASWLMRFGPQLIPQPGALIRRNAFDQIGGLDTHYKWAFDLDMFIRLSQVGTLKYISEVLASFRWHPESLSVGSRHGSVKEASEIRQMNYPRLMRIILVPYEAALTRLILWAGRALSRIARQQHRASKL
jgi:GT2 family glycosyltransferase